MRVLACLVGAASVLVVVLVLNMISVLSSLEGQPLDIALLMRGDLSELLAYGPIWTLPGWPMLEQVVAWGPLSVVAVFGALLVHLARKHRSLPSTWLAVLALGSGLVPYTVGALVLHDNVVAEHTGPWLVWMLHGPAYAALLALAFLARGRPVTAERHAIAAPESAALSA